MHPFTDLRLVALLPCYPSTVDKVLVAVILTGLAIIGGLLVNKAHSLDNIMVEYEDLRRVCRVALLVLTALLQIARAFA